MPTTSLPVLCERLKTLPDSERYETLKAYVLATCLYYVDDDKLHVVMRSLGHHGLILHQCQTEPFFQAYTNERHGRTTRIAATFTLEEMVMREWPACQPVIERTLSAVNGCDFRYTLMYSSTHRPSSQDRYAPYHIQERLQHELQVNFMVLNYHGGTGAVVFLEPPRVWSLR